MLRCGRFLFPLLLISILVTVLLCACTPAVAQETAETEIAGFILDLILTQEIGESSGMVEASAEPWQEVPPGASLIVWAPPRPDLEHTAATYLNTDEPLKVWQYVNHQIHEPVDRTGAIQQYRDAMIYNPDARSWGYYEFGVLSFSREHDEAQVYLGISCGPLCGEGLIYTLHRGESGAWEIIQADPRWIS